MNKDEVIDRIDNAVSHHMGRLYGEELINVLALYESDDRLEAAKYIVENDLAEEILDYAVDYIVASDTFEGLIDHYIDQAIYDVLGSDRYQKLM